MLDVAQCRTGVVTLGTVAIALAAAGCGGGESGASDEETYKVAFVLALSGTGSVSADAARRGMDLALEEVNADTANPVRFEVTVVDDATDPRTAADVCQRVVNQDQVDAIIGFESTPARIACNQAAMTAGIPYVAASQSGGDVCFQNLFQIGAIPNQQAEAVVNYLIGEGAKRFYLIGSDYSSPKGSFAAAAPLIEANGGTVAGTSYEPLGTTDFSAAIGRIAAARPDVVIESIVGADQIPFYKQVRSDARTSRLQFASLQLNEATARAIGPQAAGIVSTADYFASVATPANQAFVQRATAGGEGEREPASVNMVRPYDALRLLAAAVRSAGSTDGAAVIRAIPSVQLESPRGSIAFPPNNHHATLNMYIARATAEGTFELISFRPSVAPRPTCG